MGNENDQTPQNPKIVIMKDGSYHVHGNVPLVEKTQVVSEHGEPLTWKKERAIPVVIPEGKDHYSLCRCGQSGNKPFCDSTHRQIGFDGTETADTRPSKDRRVSYPGGTRIYVMKDPTLCMQSGFCGFLDAGLRQLVAASADTKIRALVMAMVERCPSGALTYRIEPGGEDIEPDLPVQIAATIEITSVGPIEGPLWVTGNIPVERSDGQPFEARNRVTLCNCGRSGQKPLCDGAHRRAQEAALREGNR